MCDLQDTEAGDIAARLVRRSYYDYQETMNLNFYEAQPQLFVFQV